MGIVHSRSPWCSGFHGSFLPTIYLNHQKSTAASRASSAVCYEGLSLQRLAFESELCCRDALNICAAQDDLQDTFLTLGLSSFKKHCLVSGMFCTKQDHDEWVDRARRVMPRRLQDKFSESREFRESMMIGVWLRMKFLIQSCLREV